MHTTLKLILTRLLIGMHVVVEYRNVDRYVCIVECLVMVCGMLRGL